MTKTSILQRNPLLVHSYFDMIPSTWSLEDRLLFLLASPFIFILFSIFSSLPTCFVGLTDESLLICVHKRKSSILSLHHFSSFINVRLQFMDISFS